MIEKTVLDYLTATLEVGAYMEESQKMPPEYVLIEKTGAGEENHIKSATIVVQSYAPTLFKAAELNEKVKEAMKEIIVLDNISRCGLNTDYNYTDTQRKKYRYQAVFDIMHY